MAIKVQPVGQWKDFRAWKLAPHLVVSQKTAMRPTLITTLDVPGVGPRTIYDYLVVVQPEEPGGMILSAFSLIGFGALVMRSRIGKIMMTMIIDLAGSYAEDWLNQVLQTHGYDISMRVQTAEGPGKGKYVHIRPVGGETVDDDDLRR